MKGYSYAPQQTWRYRTLPKFWIVHRCGAINREAAIDIATRIWIDDKTISDKKRFIFCLKQEQCTDKQ